MADDPTSSRPQPPMQTRPIAPPGHTSEMPQQPDHGEHSCKGSGRLLGRAVAIAFAREGADVLISYLNEYEDAEQTAHWVRDAGRRPVLVLPSDLGSYMTGAVIPVTGGRPML